MADPTFTTYRGTGEVALADYKSIKWVGQTKGGKAVEIAIDNAINLENINLNLVEKDEVVNTLTFQGTYDNTDAQANSTLEPWSVKVENTPTSGAGEILLGIGLFYIGQTAVALCRGGGSFQVERDYRNQRADGDRGPVKGRITMDEARPKITMNTLTWLTKIDDVWPAIGTTA